jgi:hypothetical protein
MRSNMATALSSALVATVVALALSPKPAVPATVQKLPPLAQVDHKQMARELLTTKQYKCFNKLMSKESAWNPKAKNPVSSARGIGQLLNGTYKNLGMKHSDKAVPQIVAALAYIGRKYGSSGPCGAWAHFKKHNWY